MSAICEEGLGATRPHVSDIASQYITADKPETTAAFTTSLEINPNFSTASQTSTFHKRIKHPKAAFILFYFIAIVWKA